jgi:hypothetical protein
MTDEVLGESGEDVITRDPGTGPPGADPRPTVPKAFAERLDPDPAPAGEDDPGPA